MWKKIAYAVLIFISLYFIYTIFIKKVTLPDVPIEQQMKTKKVVYKIRDDAIIYADEQIGGPNDKTIIFKNIVVDLLKRDMLIKAKEGTVDTETLNINFKGEMFGKSKDDEWNIWTESIDYIDEGARLIATEKTKIINNKDKRELEADRVETTTEFKVIVAVGNVTYKKEDELVTADRATYYDVEQVLDAMGNVKYKDKETEITADKAIYAMTPKEIQGFGNVVFKNPESTVTAGRVHYFMTPEEVHGFENVVFTNKDSTVKADKAIYFMQRNEVYGEGNVIYKDATSEITGNKGTYYIEKRQVNADGNVKYTSKEMIITASKAFYDEITQIVMGSGGGTFQYFPRNLRGNYTIGTYDLKNETLITTEAFTLFFDDYIANGTNMFYQFKTGDAQLNAPFSIRKQNFVVSGSTGYANTITKDIFANNMHMYSDQGDTIKSKVGIGSFEKREFKFDGGVDGKMRGNVKNLITDKTKLIDSEAIFFKGSTAKIYFLVDNNDNYSITRTELKKDVNVRYKDINLDSQYNEIDTAKNLILVKDNAVLKFQNNTQMISNYMYLDLNSEIGYAKNNVKIVSRYGGNNININSDTASVYNKEKKIVLEGNVKVYYDKNTMTSKKTTYYVDRGIIENEGGARITLKLNKTDSGSNMGLGTSQTPIGGNNSVDISQGTNENVSQDMRKNEEAVRDVTSRLNVSQSTVTNSSKLKLIKNITAKNGEKVIIKWSSSNTGLIDINGNITRPFYGGETKSVTLKATVISASIQNHKDFNLTVSSESLKEMLIRASNNIYVTRTANKGTSISLPNSASVNVYKGTIQIPITWNNGNNITVNENVSIEAVLNYKGESYSKSFSIKSK